MPSAYLTLLLSASALVICLFSILYFRSYLKRRTGQERILAELRQEVNNILRSINETTDRDISLIEEREKKLSSLLEEIDKRLKVYIRELEGRRGAEETYTALRPKPAPKPAPEPADTPPAGPGPSPAFPLPEFKVKPAPSAPATPVQIPVGEQIRSLAREGFAPPVIASRLGLSIAEVEFATALLERRDTQ